MAANQLGLATDQIAAMRRRPLSNWLEIATDPLIGSVPSANRRLCAAGCNVAYFCREHTGQIPLMVGSNADGFGALLLRPAPVDGSAETRNRKH